MITAVDDHGLAMAARPYPIADARRAEVIYDYSPDQECVQQQLTLSKGDFVWVLEQHPCGWWGGHKDGNVHTGWFPEAIVKLTGEDVPDDSVADDCRWAQRCTSPNASDLALRTSDHRAIASPQASRRRQEDSERQQQDAAAAAELAEANRHLEKELAEERKRHTEAFEIMKSAEAKIAQMKQEHSLRSKQMESERDRERQSLDRELHRYESERHTWSAERQQLVRQAQELDSDRKAKDEEVKRLHDELRRKEGEVVQQMNQFRALEATRERERSEAAVTAAVLERGRSEDVSHHLTASASSRDYSRGASTGVSRRLFATGMAEDARHGIASGMRTPPVGGPPPVIQQVTAVPTSSTMPSAMPTAMISSVTPLSARGNTLPRPSPRTAPGSMQWMAQPGGGPPPSPHHIHRAFAASRDPSADAAAHSAAVRGLVEAFERRSNSQGAVTHRIADPSPNRQLIYASATRAASRGPPGSSSRAASREIPFRRDVVSGEETPSGHSVVGEENSVAINFGMSPMTRQNAQYIAAAPASARNPGIASSPNAKASVSVQDRIRQLNTQRFSSGR
mmetsp:Transcript_71427/g.209724  ORF Transcript_71427/g.209724 Transcript_71427/m.209724 type:complete len:567 (+) Transcript_71427:87-1787(+)